MATVANPIRAKFPPMHRFALAAVVLGGVVLSITGFAVDRGAERRRLQADLDRRSAERVELLQGKIGRSTEVLHSISAFFQARRNDVSRSEFDQFVQSALERQPELLALSWTPRVTADDKANYESRARQNGLSAFHFVERIAADQYGPVKPRAEYWPVYYISPIDRNEVALGFDLHSDPTRSLALDAARDQATTLATSPIKLVQERGGGKGFIVFLPLYRQPSPATVTDRRASICGYTAAVFRIDDLVRSSFQGLDGGIAATIEDRTDGHETIFEQYAADTASTKLIASAPIELAGRHWLVTLRPTERFVAAHTTHRPWFVLGAGLAITGLLAAYIASILRRRTEIERQVHDRTAALSMEITERRRAEALAVETERLYRGIFENCIDGIFQTTADGHYLSVNPALTKLYGYDTPQNLITALSDIGRQLYVEPHRRQEFVAAVQQFGQVMAFESQVYRRDGTIIWISENARAVRSAAGELLYYEGMVEDITARKTAEESLRRANDELEQRVRERTNELAASNEALHEEAAIRRAAEARADAANRAKSVFLANMGHEIRTPMNAIVGYAQILRHDPNLRAQQREAVETIVAGGDHLLGLIGDLLDLSKIEAGRMDLRPVAFELGALIKDVTLLFGQKCQEKGIKLSARLYPPGPHHVFGDEGKLRQVLINLLGNAVKYTDRGEVALHVETSPDEHFQFEVVDTGEGIPLNLLDSIFEPFQQGEGADARGGTGLGLAIAKRHVALMGGDLCVASTLGQGSTFYFAIPLPSASKFETALPQANPAQPNVAEDDADDVVEIPSQLLESMLRSAEMGSVADIKVAARYLESLGSAQARLAKRISGYLKRFDTEGVLNLLSSDSVSPAADIDPVLPET